MINRTRYLFLLLTVFLSQNLLAKQYGYSDGVPFYLGGGIDPLTINEGFRPCISRDSEVRLDGQGARQSGVVLRVTKSRQEFLHTIGASVEVAAQAFFANANASTSFADQTDFFEDSLTWIISGSVIHGRVILKSPELLPKFQKMLDEGQHTTFATACGTQYISQETRGASVFAIYSLHNLSQSQKTRFESLLKAGADLGALDAKLEAEFKSVLTKASHSSQMDFRAFALGGGGIQDLANLITDSGDIQAVQKTLRNYLRTMTIENSVALSYLSSSMAHFGYTPSTPLDIEKRDQVLTQYYLLIKEASDNTTRLYGVIGRMGGIERRLSEEQLAYYKGHYETTLKTLETLYAEADACYKATRQCTYPKIILPPIVWPTNTEKCVDIASMTSRITDKERPTKLGPSETISATQCEAIRTQALSSSCINDREYLELKLLGALPICIENSKSLAWYFC